MRIGTHQVYNRELPPEILINELHAETEELAGIEMQSAVRDIEHSRADNDRIHATQADLNVDMQAKLAEQRQVVTWKDRLSMFTDFATGLIGVAAGGITGAIAVGASCVSAADRYAKSSGLYGRVSPWVETAVGTVAKIGQLTPLLCGGAATNKGLKQAINAGECVVTGFKGLLGFKATNIHYDLAKLRVQSQDLDVEMSLKKIDGERAQERIQRVTEDRQQNGDVLDAVSSKFNVEKRIARSMRL